jgi:large subunit ribosomal protein L22
MVEIKAELRYFRTAPRKVRLLADLIRGLPLKKAKTQLKFNPKAAAGQLLKLLNSAEANAKNNFKINNSENLFIKEIRVDEGPVLKRYMPRARGRATMIRRRTSHIKVVLQELKNSSDGGDNKRKSFRLKR